MSNTETGYKGIQQLVQTFTYRCLIEVQEVEGGKTSEPRLVAELREKADLKTYEGGFAASFASLAAAVNLAMAMMDDAGVDGMADRYLERIAGATRSPKENAKR